MKLLPLLLLATLISVAATIALATNSPRTAHADLDDRVNPDIPVLDTTWQPIGRGRLGMARVENGIALGPGGIASQLTTLNTSGSIPVCGDSLYKAEIDKAIAAWNAAAGVTILHWEGAERLENFLGLPDVQVYTTDHCPSVTAQDEQAILIGQPRAIRCNPGDVACARPWGMHGSPNYRYWGRG